MKRIPPTDLLAGILFLFLTALQFSNLSQIPFHPDEASLLYQSRDLELVFTDPHALTFNPTRRDELDQTYRTLNPPLPKYVLAVGRKIAGFGYETVSVDWNWSLTWEENERLGALPGHELLRASRIASTVMGALSMVLIYICGKRLQSPALGILAAVLLGTHTLVLLHGRRAMAEGTLLFGISLALLGILDGDRRSWLAGLGTGIAVCTKLSAAALVPVGLIAVIWVPKGRKPRTIVQNVIVFILVSVFVYFLLNPLVWTHPIQAIQAQWTERTQFVQGMIEEFEFRAPNQVLDDPLERFGAMLAHIFISDPQFAEVGNYLAATAGSEEIYLSSPFSALFRGLIAGGVILTITLLGVASWVLDIRKMDWQMKRKTTLIFLSSAILTLALIWANPLPFQRYYIPLVPFVCIWSGLGIQLLVYGIKQAISILRWPEKDKR